MVLLKRMFREITHQRQEGKYKCGVHSHASGTSVWQVRLEKAETRNDGEETSVPYVSLDMVQKIMRRQVNVLGKPEARQGETVLYWGVALNRSLKPIPELDSPHFIGISNQTLMD